MAAISQVEGVARQLQEENRRIKARVNEEDERLKRLATRVKKEEELVAQQSKKIGVKPEQLKELALKDAGVKKLLQQVREKEKQNQALERHITLYKHSIPQQQHTGASGRRPLLDPASKSPQQQQNPTSPGQSGKRGKDMALMQGIDEDEQQRVILVLEGDLQRSREHLTQLRELAAQASGSAKEDASKISADSVDELKKRQREIGARLTILLNTQERTRGAFREEEEQHSTLVSEVESLNSMLSEVRQATQELSRNKQIMLLRKGDADDIGKLIAQTRKELDELDADNRRLRDKAFQTGAVKHAVRATEEEQRIKLEENKSLKEELKRLQDKIEKLQADVDEIEKGQQGSVQSLQKNLTNLDQQARHLQQETERLREKVLIFSGQQKSASGGLSVLLAPGGSSVQHPVGFKRDQDKGKEVRRLRRENAQQVREIRKAEQELRLHQLLLQESGLLEQDLSKHIEAMSKTHGTKTALLQRKLTLIEMNNSRLRNRLRDVQQGKQPSDSARASGAAAPVLPPDAKAAALSAAVSRSVVEICVEGLVLDKSHPALEGTEEPRTMLLLDFFMHDTQYSGPLVGFAPRGKLQRSFETVVDQLLMHYLHTDFLRIQLVRIIGLEAEPLGECKVQLAKLIESSSSPSLVEHSLEISDATAGGKGGNVGHLNILVKFLASIKDAAHTFLANMPRGVVGDRKPQSESPLQLKENMVRRVGATYVLRVKVTGVSGGPAKLAVVAMFQLLDSDVCASNAVITTLDGKATLTGAQLELRLAATQELDKCLLSQAMDVCLFDDTDASSNNGLIGAGHLLLAPLLHRRGVSGAVQLHNADKSSQVVASLSVDLCWDPEPIAGIALVQPQPLLGYVERKAGAAASSLEEQIVPEEGEEAEESSIMRPSQGR